MKYRIFRNALVVCIILLFIGVTVQPSIATIQPESIDVEYSSDTEEDCNCQPVSKSHLVLIEMLLKILEKYDNQLSILSKLNPEFEEKYQEVSERISTLQGLIRNDNFCNFLGVNIVIYLSIIGISFSKELIIFDIILDIIFGTLFIITFTLWYKFCFEEYPYMDDRI